jgi:O-antigen/teichoic acid export membrane protein
MRLIETIKELSKDSLYFGLSSVLSQIVSLFLVPFYTKELSPESYGVILMLSLLITFIIPISSLSLDGAFIRYFSFADDSEKQKYFSTSFLLKLLGILVCWVLVYLLFDLINRHLFEDKLDILFLVYINLMILFESLSMLFFSYLRVKRLVKKILYINLVSLFIGLFFSVLLVIVYKWGLNGAVIAALIGAVIKFIVLFFMIVRSDTFIFSKTISRKLLNYSLPKIPHKVFTFIIASSTVLFINETLGLISAGIYFVAAKLAKPINLITSVIQQAWVPYRLEVHKMNNKSSLFKNLSLVYLSSLIFLWLLISSFIPEIYYLLINTTYHSGIKYVPFILLVPISNAFYYMYITGYELHHDQNYLLKCSVLVSLIQLLLCYFLMDFYPPFNFIFFNILSFILLAFLIKVKANEIVKFKLNFFLILTYLIFNLSILILLSIINFNLYYKIFFTLISLLFLIFINRNSFKTSTQIG